MMDINLKKNKVMKNILKIMMLFCFALAFTGCSDDEETLKPYEGSEVLSLDRPTQAIGACEPTSTIVVQSSAVSSSDRSYTLMVNVMSSADPSEYVLGTSVTIPAGSYLGSTDVTIDFAAIPEGAVRTLVVDLVVPDGLSATRETTSISYESVCVLNELTVDLTFDAFPEEAAYLLFDATGSIVDASYNADGNIAFGTFAGLGSFSKTLCLPSGDYTVRFLDSYGDGNSEGTGSYGMSLQACDGTSTLFEALSSSTFGAPGSTLGTAAVNIAFTID
jgi:hypothetical protein